MIINLLFDTLLSLLVMNVLLITNYLLNNDFNFITLLAIIISITYAFICIFRIMKIRNIMDEILFSEVEENETSTDD